jgi:hypothetical protein
MRQVLKDAFWALPHEVRRGVATLVRPESVRRMQRERRGEHEDNPTCITHFDQHRFIFIHVPKVAGTSVGRALGVRLGLHATIRQYSLALSRQDFDAYFKFGFVRNPWDRLYSAFRFMKHGGTRKTDSEREWVQQNLAAYVDFESFVTGWLPRVDLDRELYYHHLTPQYQFLCIQGRRPAVDFIGRFETLADDFEVIRRRLGLEVPLEHLNPSTQQGDYRTAYSDEMKRIVARAYRTDIELFGYEFDGLRSAPAVPKGAAVVPR